MRVLFFVVAGGYSHVCLYEILRKFEAYFYLCCGQNRIKIWSARGGYMKLRQMKKLNWANGSIC